MQVFVLERVIPPFVITFKLAVESVSSNHIFVLLLFLFNSHYLKKSGHGLGPKPFHKNKRVSMDSIHDTGSTEPVQSGGPWTPGPCFVLWIQSNHRIEFSNLILPIAHLLAGRLACANWGKFLWRIRHPAGSWMAAAKIFPQFRQVAWASVRRLIAHLIAYACKVYKRYGGVMLRFWPFTAYAHTSTFNLIVIPLMFLYVVQLLF